METEQFCRGIPKGMSRFFIPVKDKMQTKLDFSRILLYLWYGRRYAD